MPWRTMTDMGVLEAAGTPGSPFSEANQIAIDLAGLRSQKDGLVGQGQNEEQQVKRLYDLYAYRNQVPAILNMINKCILDFAKDQPRFGPTEADRQKAIDLLRRKPRAERQMITVDLVDIIYMPDIRTLSSSTGAPAPAGEAKRGWKVNITGHTPRPRDKAEVELIAPIRRRSLEISSEQQPGLPSPIKVVSCTTPKLYKYLAPAEGATGTGAPAHAGPATPAATPAPAAGTGGTTAAPGVLLPDPLMAWATPVDGAPAVEDMSNDTAFELTWVISIETNGLPPLMPTKAPEADAASGSRQ
jgi:hypothetical protein